MTPPWDMDLYSLIFGRVSKNETTDHDHPDHHHPALPHLPTQYDHLPSMKVAIAGTCGLAQHIARGALSQGHEVVLLSRNVSPHRLSS
jgi:hypothetical protein